MERLADGWWIKRIAQTLGTSPHTVRNQRAMLLQKLQLESEKEMMRLVIGNRWFEAMAVMRGWLSGEQHGRLAAAGRGRIPSRT